MMNLDKRQKVILGLIVLALIVLIWQIYKLAGANSNAAPQVVTTPSTAVTTTAKPSATPAAAAAVRNNAIETAAMLSNAADNAPGASAATDDMSSNQQKYLELVNEYQMSEIQRMIAEDQASIAQSRYNAAQALSKISELSGGTANLSSLAGTTDQGNPNEYDLIYTGEDNGQWTATLKKNGQFNDVTAGSILPDGAKVLSVDDNGVLLQQGAAKMLVTFNGVTPFNSDGTTPGTTAAQISNNSSQAMPSKTAAAPTKPIMPSSQQPSAPKTPATTVTQTATQTTAQTTITEGVPLKQPNLAAAKVVAQSSGQTEEKSPHFMDLNKNDYTIQIIADDQLGSVQNFINANALQNNATALKTLRNGKPWYIAVYGDYASSSAAFDAMKNMPNHIRAERPFVRRVGDVQVKVVQ